ncbi:hypothetical protein HELRODRAFT_130526, partial [Helobdella robusta]|uniref:BK channel n=1 Tax=Helobdella robusta TaxID=6412 RepID=T1EHU1_HELRO
SIISLVIYIIDASKENPVEKDYFVKYYPSDILDLVCNLFFLVHFIFKFIAANDKLRFWVELTTVVDMVTIPPMFVALYLHKYWLGLRFVCVFRLLNFSDVLQSLYLLRTSNHIRLVELFSMFICVWVGSGGFIHLVENSGDPFTCYDNVHRISYWESMYLVIITMSTVGYGDEYCITVLGKIFIVVFLFGAIAMFASSVPEIIEIFHHSRDKYMLCYKKEPGVRHLIVGGHISFQTVGNFVRNFSHNDRLNKNLKSIILDDNPPSIELESLYKRYYNQILFIKGSIMVIKDLKRAKLSSAEAVLIMTNQSAPSATEEDTDNIMRAIAVKNYCPKARIILQLLKAENKTICKNLPFWTSRDHIICFTEMKMAFMAAGCLAPGFSTFLSNLLLMFSYDKKIKNLIEWQNDYLKGAEMEIYTEKFSPFFRKKPVHEVVKFCYTKFHMLLLAVMNSVDSRGEVNTRLLINSTCNDSFIGPQTLGFFICTNKSKARIALLYCSQCHENSAPTFTRIKKCSC